MVWGARLAAIIKKEQLMSLTDYQTLLPQIQQIAAEDIKTPNIPIDVFIQEAVNLKEWASDDQAALMGVGLPESSLDLLEQGAGALSHAQAVWMKERYSQEEAKKLWDAQSPAAYELRSDLEAAFDYAFDGNEELLAKVDAIKEGTGHEDMIQDLVELSVLGKDHKAELTAINFDHTQLDTADRLAEEMRNLLAQVNGEDTKKEEKTIRDQAYTLLKETVDKVRKAGRYALRKQPERVKGYGSSYFRH